MTGQWQRLSRRPQARGAGRGASSHSGDSGSGRGRRRRRPGTVRRGSSVSAPATACQAPLFAAPAAPAAQPSLLQASLRNLTGPSNPALLPRSPVVAASVLCSAVHLMSNNADIIKRWVNEVQEAVQSKHPMVQFHAVALLHALRATDRLAVSKLVTQLTKAAVKSPLAQCLLVRYVAQVCGCA